MSAAGRPDGVVRVARVLAGDAEPAAVDAPAPAAAAAAEAPAQPRWREDTAYLAPQLAFNLGLPYQLAPFLPRAAAAPGAAGGERGGCAVTVEALQPPSADVPPGEGRPARGFAQRPGLAAGVTVACLAEPDASVLRRGGGARDPADPAAGPADSDAAEPAPSAEVAGEQLVAALRRHFSDAPRREPPVASPPATPACHLAHPPRGCELGRLRVRRRLLAEGDVFAAATEDASGQCDLLRALFRPGDAGAALPVRLRYFRVVNMQPRTSGSLLVDCRHSSIALEVCRKPAFLKALWAQEHVCTKLPVHAASEPCKPQASLQATQCQEGLRSGFI